MTILPSEAYAHAEGVLSVGELHSWTLLCHASLSKGLRTSKPPKAASSFLAAFWMALYSVTMVLGRSGDMGLSGMQLNQPILLPSHGIFTTGTNAIAAAALLQRASVTELGACLSDKLAIPFATVMCST